jgi:hypothetical protein
MNQESNMFRNLSACFVSNKNNCWGCGSKAAQSSPMKPRHMQGPYTVLESPAYLRLFRRKEPASRRSPGTIRAQVGSDKAEVLGASEGRTGGC